MPSCAIGRGVVPDAAGAAQRAVCGVVLLSRFAHPSSIKKYVNAGVIPSRQFLYHEIPSTRTVMQNPIVIR